MRTLQNKRDFRLSLVLDNDRPQTEVPLFASVRPQSVEIYVNGVRINREQFLFDDESNCVTVPFVLWEGDTVLVLACRK